MVPCHSQLAKYNYFEESLSGLQFVYDFLKKSASNQDHLGLFGTNGNLIYTVTQSIFKNNNVIPIQLNKGKVRQRLPVLRMMHFFVNISIYSLWVYLLLQLNETQVIILYVVHYIRVFCIECGFKNQAMFYTCKLALLVGPLNGSFCMCLKKYLCMRCVLYQGVCGIKLMHIMICWLNSRYVILKDKIFMGSLNTTQFIKI